jgi:hypothetical protein
MPAGVPFRKRLVVSATIPANTGAATQVSEGNRPIYGFWLHTAALPTSGGGGGRVFVFLSNPGDGTTAAVGVYAVVQNGGFVPFPGWMEGSAERGGVPEFWLRSADGNAVLLCDVIVTFDCQDLGGVFPGSANPVTGVTVTSAGDYGPAASATATLNAGAASTLVTSFNAGTLIQDVLITIEKHVGAAIGTPRVWAGETVEMVIAGGATGPFTSPMCPPTPTGTTRYLAFRAPPGITGSAAIVRINVDNPDTVQNTYRVALVPYR